MGLGKSFKKAFKSVVKVASLGAIGKGGWGSKAVGALSLGLVGDSSVYGKGGGLGMLTGNTGAAADAAKQQEMLAAQERQQQAALAAQQAIFQSNMSADLGRDNMTNVVAGGSALGFDSSVLGDNPKRKRQGSQLSSTLGIG